MTALESCTRSPTARQASRSDTLTLNSHAMFALGGAFLFHGSSNCASLRVDTSLASHGIHESAVLMIGFVFS